MRSILTITLSLWLWTLHGQSTITYTVDEGFSTGTMISGSGGISDFYPLEDGGFFLGGGFNPMLGGDENSPFDKGLAMITAEGSLHPEWGGIGMQWAIEIHDHMGGYLVPTGQNLTKLEYNGENWYFTQGDYWGDYFLFGEFGSGWVNPYEVASVWDIYIQDDESVLIGGAIATDTLQPNLFRHLMRLLPDGSHDDSFPIIEVMPQHFTSYISRIEKASDGSWYVSGWFEGINGHYSPHVAHLTADFEVDTTFVSPLKYAPNFDLTVPMMRLLDTQDRIWVSGVRVFLEETPNDTLSLLRILPNGDLDSSFEPRRVTSDYPISWDNNPRPWILTVEENQSHEGHYFLTGVFTHYEGTEASCIVVVDDQGIVQENYFQGDGATVNQYHLEDPNAYKLPRLITLEQLPDGSLLIGGAFTEFMGVERHDVVKLSQGTVSTEDQDRFDRVLRVFPNPASGAIRVKVISATLNVPSQIQAAERPPAVRPGSRSPVLNLIDLSGRIVASYPWRTDGIFDISGLAKGVYLIELTGDEGVLGVEKIIKE